jgi:hypothetical protein
MPQLKQHLAKERTQISDENFNRCINFDEMDNFEIHILIINKYFVGTPFLHFLGILQI